jgi:hypothetical protein
MSAQPSHSLARRSLVSTYPLLLLVVVLAVLPACKHRRDKNPDRTTPPDTSMCAEARLPTEPDLMAWDSASRANLASMHEEGVIAVRYHLDGCEPKLTVLPNCIGPRDPLYKYKPYSATDKKIAHTTQELFAELPLGAASLRAKLGRDRAVRADYALVGLLTLPPASSWRRDDLKGTGCEEATHVVARIYLGGFALASGNATEIEAAASFFAIGNAGAAHKSQRIEVQTEGEEDACVKARTSGEGQRMCNVPLRIGLIPLEGVVAEEDALATAPKLDLERGNKEVTIFTDDPVLGQHVEAEVRALGYSRVTISGDPNSDINVKCGPEQGPYADELAAVLTRTLGLPQGTVNHLPVLDDSQWLFINLPATAVGSVGGRLPGADATKAALSITVFTGDPATGEKVRDAIRAAGYPTVDLNPLPNSEFNIKWGQAPARLVEELVGIASRSTGVPKTDFARQNIFTAEDTDVYINLPIETLGAGRIPTSCGQDAATVDFGPIAVGTKVVLGRHTPVNGDTNWNDAMDGLVGQTASITSLDGVDMAGCPRVKVDVDQGLWAWRIRDLRLAK